MKTDTSMDLLSFCGLYCGNCSGYTRGMPLMGKCAGCQKANDTLKMMVEKTLKDMVDQRIKVIEV